MPNTEPERPTTPDEPADESPQSVPVAKSDPAPPDDEPSSAADLLTKNSIGNIR